YCIDPPVLKTIHIRPTREALTPSTGREGSASSNGSHIPASATEPPPTSMGARAGAPAPAASPAHTARAGTASLVPWLYPLKIWSLHAPWGVQFAAWALFRVCACGEAGGAAALGD